VCGVCVKERECECVYKCVSVWEREKRYNVWCVCVCVCERVWVCVRESERESERSRRQNLLKLISAIAIFLVWRESVYEDVARYLQLHFFFFFFFLNTFLHLPLSHPSNCIICLTYSYLLFQRKKEGKLFCLSSLKGNFDHKNETKDNKKYLLFFKVTSQTLSLLLTISLGSSKFNNSLKLK